MKIKMLKTNKVLLKVIVSYLNTPIASASPSDFHMHCSYLTISCKIFKVDKVRFKLYVVKDYHNIYEILKVHTQLDII